MTFYLDVKKKTGMSFIYAFDTIPEDTTILDISGNDLGLKAVDDLMKGFKKIPAGVKTLVLKKNKLNEKSVIELRKIIEALPATITKLYLCGNDLGRLSTDDLIYIFSAISPQVTSLRLFDNSMNLKTCAELTKIYRALPANITSLHLGEGVPCRHTPNQLTDIIKAMPVTVKTVTIDKVKFDLSNIHNITNEIARMENSKWKKGSFLVNMGVIESSDAKIKALVKLKTLLIHLMDVRVNPDECIDAIRTWKETHWACISKQRNCIHSYFVPYHMPTSAKVVDDIFEVMGISDKEPKFTTVTPDFFGIT